MVGAPLQVVAMLRFPESCQRRFNDEDVAIRPTEVYLSSTIATRKGVCYVYGMTRPERSDRVLVAIGLFKLVKSVTLVALGLSVAFDQHSLAAHLRVLGHAFGIRPRYIDEVVAKIAATSPQTLAALGVGALMYGALFAVEGFGLVRRRLWAEYMTTVITTSFIPIEVYEMIASSSLLKAIVILMNLGIVVYLLWRLRRDQHWPFAPRPKPDAVVES